MIILPTLTTSLIHFSSKVGRMYFLSLGVKVLNETIYSNHLYVVMQT